MRVHFPVGYCCPQYRVPVHPLLGYGACKMKFIRRVLRVLEQRSSVQANNCEDVPK